MRRHAVFGLVIGLVAAAGAAGAAQPQDGRACPPDRKACVLPDRPERTDKAPPHGKRPPARDDAPDETRRDAHPARPPAQDGRHPRHAAEHRRDTPHIGDSGRGGQAVHRAPDSRFRPAPQGQEYRVVKDYLVLIDSRTQKIVTVLGRLDPSGR